MPTPESSPRSRSLLRLAVAALAPVLLVAAVIGATWKGENRIDNVQAAIVNQDAMVTVNGQTVPVGRLLEQKLVGDGQHTITWVPSDAAGAADGLRSGQYAAVVTIPASFSADAMSYATDATHAKRASVGLALSQTAGVIDPGLARVLVDNAIGKVNDDLTAGYLSQLYQGFSAQGQQLKSISDATKQLADGSRQATDGAQQLADGEARSAAGAGQIADAQGQLAQGAAQLADGQAQLAQGARGLASGVSQYTGGVDQSAAGAAKLAQNTGQYAAGVQQYVDGVKQVAAGAQQLGAGGQAVASGLQQYQATISSDQFATQVAAQACPSAQTDPVGYQNCITGVYAGSRAAAQALNTPGQNGQTLVQGAQALGAGGGQLAQSAGALTSGGDQLVAGANGINTGVQQLSGGLARLSGGSGQLNSGAQQLASGAEQSVAGARQLADGEQQAAGGTRQLADGQSQLAAGAKTLADNLGKLADGNKKLADGFASQQAVPDYTPDQRAALSTAVAAPIQQTGAASPAPSNPAWPMVLLVAGLWLGALVTFAVRRPVPARLAMSNGGGLAALASSLLPGLAVVELQALALWLVGLVAVRPSVSHALALLGVLLVAGLAFTLVNHALAAWLGTAGRVIAAILLALALAAVFTDAVPGFFGSAKGLSPVWPAMAAAKAAAAGGSGITGDVLALLGWLAVALIASVAAVLAGRRARATSLATA